MLTFRMRRRFWLYLAVGAMAAAFLAALVRETSGLSDQIARLAPSFGYILITIGWIVTSEVNIGNSRRQHTITLITQHAFEPQRAAHRDIIKLTLPTYRSRLHAAPGLDFDDELSPLLKAIDRELNFYEFLAVGAASGNLDERLLKESLGGQFKAFYAQVEEYVVHWRKKNDATWRELSRMYARWSGV